VPRTLLLALAGCTLAFCSDELTVYELLAPQSHSFAITYECPQPLKVRRTFLIRFGVVGLCPTVSC
jgi:hypothetical protein